MKGRLFDLILAISLLILVAIVGYFHFRKYCVLDKNGMINEVTNISYCTNSELAEGCYSIDVYLLEEKYYIDVNHFIDQTTYKTYNFNKRPLKSSQVSKLIDFSNHLDVYEQKQDEIEALDATEYYLTINYNLSGTTKLQFNQEYNAEILESIYLEIILTL